MNPRKERRSSLPHGRGRYLSKCTSHKAYRPFLRGRFDISSEKRRSYILGEKGITRENQRNHIQEGLGGVEQNKKAYRGCIFSKKNVEEGDEGGGRGNSETT